MSEQNETTSQAEQVAQHLENESNSTQESNTEFQLPLPETIPIQGVHSTTNNNPLFASNPGMPMTEMGAFMSLMKQQMLHQQQQMQTILEKNSKKRVVRGSAES